MNPTPKEKIVIDNFFSIDHFEWEIKNFNILTGEMASGKSICLKLVYFIEQIFHNIIFFSNTFSKDTLEKEAFYSVLLKEFNKYFHNTDKSHDFHKTSITYSYTYLDVVFDLTAEWNDKELKWNSEYINSRIDEWRGFFSADNTPDVVYNVRNRIYERLSHDFSYTFPIGAEFIPASRAIAAIANPPNIPDPYLDYFINNDKSFVLRFDEITDNEVNKILHLNTITVKTNKDTHEKTLEVEALDGRKITPLELSSGQQELIYLLLLIKNLDQTTFIYGRATSIFIEEPSAHLFPQEQKESIEYIVKIFRKLQSIKEKNNARFFISTHSPYVLNVINNMLKKGYLIEKINICPDEANKKLMQEEIKKLNFPHLSVYEISAHFIQKEVGNMINESENGAYLYEEMIEDITQKINSDYKQVKKILDQFKD